MLAQIVDTLDEMTSGLVDAKDLLLMSAEEEDQAAVDDVAAEVERLRESLEKLEFRRMFSGEMDQNNAYLDIQAGLRRYRSAGLGQHPAAHVPALG